MSYKAADYLQGRRVSCSSGCIYGQEYMPAQKPVAREKPTDGRTGRQRTEAQIERIRAGMRRAWERRRLQV